MSSMKVVRSSMLCLSAICLGVSPLAANMVGQAHAALGVTPTIVTETVPVSKLTPLTVIPTSSRNANSLTELETESTRYVFVVTDPLTGAGVLTLAGGAALADGPLPIGDIIGAGIIIGGLIIIWSQTPEEAIHDVTATIGEIESFVWEGEQLIDEAIQNEEWIRAGEIQKQVDAAKDAIRELWERIDEILSENWGEGSGGDRAGL